jgi:hypothetical protein
MNALRVISPYKHLEMWVFDDETTGLVREPFVSGMDLIIERIVTGNGPIDPIPEAESGFRLVFSAKPFPGYQVSLEYRRPEHEGNWYYCPELEMEGWLCPALYHYYRCPPERLYFQCAALPSREARTTATSISPGNEVHPTVDLAHGDRPDD